jgi:hypothetical protein
VLDRSVVEQHVEGEPHSATLDHPCLTGARPNRLAGADEVRVE